MKAKLKTIVDNAIVHASDKKAFDIAIIDVERISTLTDAFVFCSGLNTVHIDAIAQEVCDKLPHEHKQVNLIVSGTKDSGWIVIDGGEFIMHVMLKEIRDYYKIESIWQDGTVTYYE